MYHTFWQWLLFASWVCNVWHHTIPCHSVWSPGLCTRIIKKILTMEHTYIPCTYTSAYTHHTYTHTHSHTITHARTHACTHVRTHTHSHTQSHMHARTHAHTRTHTHTHIHDYFTWNFCPLIMSPNYPGDYFKDRKVPLRLFPSQCPSRSCWGKLFSPRVSKATIQMPHLFFKRRVPAPLPRIGRAVICNGKSDVLNMGKLNMRGCCG